MKIFIIDRENFAPRNNAAKFFIVFTPSCVAINKTEGIICGANICEGNVNPFKEAIYISGKI